MALPRAGAAAAGTATVGSNGTQASHQRALSEQPAPRSKFRASPSLDGTSAGLAWFGCVGCWGEA